MSRRQPRIFVVLRLRLYLIRSLCLARQTSSVLGYTTNELLSSEIRSAATAIKYNYDLNTLGCRIYGRHMVMIGISVSFSSNSALQRTNKVGSQRSTVIAGLHYALIYKMRIFLTVRVSCMCVRAPQRLPNRLFRDMLIGVRFEVYMQASSESSTDRLSGITAGVRCRHPQCIAPKSTCRTPDTCA